MHNTRKCLHNFCFSAYFFVSSIFLLLLADFCVEYICIICIPCSIFLYILYYYTVDDIVGARTTVNMQMKSKRVLNNTNAEKKSVFFIIITVAAVVSPAHHHRWVEEFVLKGSKLFHSNNSFVVRHLRYVFKMVFELQS